MIYLLSVLLCFAIAACCYLAWLNKPLLPEDKSVSTAGFSVEVDCRACGKFNRVPQERLRDRPKCGRCKVRLMPKKSVVICRVSSMEAGMRADINKVWDDEDKLWATLADHVTLKNKAEKEKQNPDLRVVN